MAGIVRSDSAPGAVQCQCGKLHHHHYNTGGSSGAVDSLRNLPMFGNKSVLTFGVLTDLPSSVKLLFPCVKRHPFKPKETFQQCTVFVKLFTSENGKEEGHSFAGQRGSKS